MPRVTDNERDVYGLFIVTVVNAYRLARRAEHLMSDDEWAIIESTYNQLIALDPHAANVRKAKIVASEPYIRVRDRPITNPEA
jgi:hypothetical protein